MTDNIVRVNMATLEVTAAPLPQDLAALGGRAMTNAILCAEVAPTCDPLGSENKLVFAPGLLGGSTAPISGRLSVGCKSPLTGGIKEANSGGQGGQILARLGIRALVVEGVPVDAEKRYTLEIDVEGFRLVECPELKGLGNYDTVEKLVAKYGDKKIGFMTIGMAGEMLMKASTVAVTDRELRPTRHAARGGVGAVMGSKALKAIVLNDAGTKMRQPVNKDAFRTASRKFTKALLEHPVVGEGLPTYGTNVLMNIINESGGLPTNNFDKGSFVGVEKISGEAQHDIILERGGKIAHGCHSGCVIKCSRIYNDKDGNYLTKGPEYETVWSHGPQCGIDDLDAIALMDRMDDDIGVDTIDMGAAIGVAMDGGKIEFGDVEGAIALLEEVKAGTPFGRILGDGAQAVGEHLGVERIPTVKNQAMPAYDPRAIQGIGVTYATTPQGADHTAGYAIATNILQVGGHVDPLSPDGQVELSRNLQIATAAVDATGLCLFVAFAALDKPEAFEAIYEMINGLYGLSLGAEDVSNLGMAVLSMERKFNAAAGFTAEDDRLPKWMKSAALEPHNAVFTVPDEELDEVFNFVK